MGIEPTTARLRAARSTDWARKATDMFLFTSSFFSNFFYQLIYFDFYMWERVIMRVCVYVYEREYERETLYLRLLLFWRDESRRDETFMLMRFFLFLVSSPFHLPYSFFLTLTHFFLFTFYCAVLVLPLILFPLFSLGSFRGSVGRAIGC